MAISIDIPADIEQHLREEVHNLDQSAKESILVEMHRQGKLTHQQFSRALGVSRFGADAILKRHQVYYDQNAQDVTRESEGLRKLRESHDHRR